MNSCNPYLAQFLAADGAGYENLWADLAAFAANAKLRKKLVAEFAWAVPTDRVLALIAGHSPLVEMGAGTGYWANQLNQKDADVIAYDLQPPQPDCRHQWGHFRQYTQVLFGTPENLSAHSNRTLLLCWPPMGSMATDCLHHWQGETLIYIGEGSGGINADDEFFAALGRDFVLQCEMEIPRWYGIHDWVGIYRYLPRTSR